MFFLWVLLSCEGRLGNNKQNRNNLEKDDNKLHCVNREEATLNSVTIDIRCKKIKKKAYVKGKQNGVCYNGPEGGVQGKHPDPEKCQALLEEAERKCKALPPDPKSMKILSGTIIYKDGDPVSINGEPVPNDQAVCLK